MQVRVKKKIKVPHLWYRMSRLSMNLVHEYVLQGCAMSSTNFFFEIKEKILKYSN